MASKSPATLALTSLLVVGSVSLAGLAHAYDEGPPPDFAKPALTPTLAPSPTSTPTVAPTPTPAPVAILAPSFSATPNAEPRPPLATEPLADEGGGSAPPRNRKVFYGWQNLTVSYAGLGLFYGTIGSGSSEMPILGAFVYGIGSPIVHLANGDGGGKAVGSLFINALTPVLLGALAHTADKPCSTNREEGCGLETVSGLIYGAMLGSLVAPLLDGFLLGWKEEKTPQFGIAPAVTIARKEDPTSTTTVGVSGFF